MTDQNRNRLALLALTACAGAALAGCGGAKSIRAEVKTEQAAARDPLAVKVTDDLARQIKIGEPAMANVVGTLRVSGRVEADETRMARVSAPVTGRVVQLEVVEGQAVKKGDVIAVIRSTGLSDAQSNFVKAVSQRQVAERAVDRAKRLLEADVIAPAELQRREAELVQATAEAAALRDQLRVLGMPEQALNKLETSRAVNSISEVLATIDGTVLERKITEGQVVQAAEVVCILADLSRVWLVADVPEQVAGNLQAGKAVEAEIPALPDQPIRGKLTFVSATVNRETGTVRARMDLANPRRKYKPAMLATMLLQEGEGRKRVVPAGAVVRENNQEFVFAQASEGKFRLTPVNLGAEAGDNRVLINGLEPGQRIALDGAFHLNNERKRQALQTGE
ncbi:MAG: efflux RND transporter periplasmic adaptor subunit [Proteobacteria bacterium]|nr:efflux RND transporter periplasmic adaptor subunit [Pseudomonadota bacterium]